MTQRRVGVFGGTFDPPHLGHLLLAETIREQFALGEVLFVPCNEPPHKERPDLTAATHRYAMVVAATLQNPTFSPSALEVNRPGKSYSIDTVRALSDELGADTRLFFVAGLDSFLQIETWKESAALLEACSFIVVSRPNNSFDRVREVLPESVHTRLTDTRGDAAADVDPNDLRIYLSDAVHFDLSSTEIRRRARAGESVRYRVTSEVERYIHTHELYAASAVATAAVT